MKRLLFCLFLVAVLILPGAFCQAAPAIDGYQQLKWGAPENAVRAFAAASGWIADSVEESHGTRLLFYEGTYEGHRSIIACKLYNGKFYELGVVYAGQQRSGLADWQAMTAQLTQRYGPPHRRFYTFDPPYRDGDGYEDEAVRLGKGRVMAVWMDADKNTVLCELTPALLIKVVYQDEIVSGIVDEAAEKRQTAKQ